MKKLLFALLLAPLFFTACKKANDSSEFDISGVRDVNFAASNGNTLSLSVSQTNGEKQPVTITVTDLPAGVTADIQPASGTPSFTVVIKFLQSGTPVAGTYPIHIVGTSSAYSKTYDLNLVVPVLNGFVFDGMTFSRSSLMHNTTNIPPYVISTLLISSFDHGSATLQAGISTVWPSADGTYNYHIGGSAPNAMSLTYSNNATSATYDTRSLTDTSKMATLKITGGKFSLIVDNATLQNFAGTVSKTVVVNASE